MTLDAAEPNGVTNQTSLHADLSGTLSDAETCADEETGNVSDHNLEFKASATLEPTHSTRDILLDPSLLGVLGRLPSEVRRQIYREHFTDISEMENRASLLRVSHAVYQDVDIDFVGMHFRYALVSFDFYAYGVTHCERNLTTLPPLKLLQYPPTGVKWMQNVQSLEFIILPDLNNMARFNEPENAEPATGTLERMFSALPCLELIGFCFMGCMSKRISAQEGLTISMVLLQLKQHHPEIGVFHEIRVTADSCESCPDSMPDAIEKNLRDLGWTFREYLEEAYSISWVGISPDTRSLDMS